MKRSDKAIVTMAIGDRYLRPWKIHCEANWRAYADRYGFDLICIEKPFDTSRRALQRNPSWQKCLILGQPILRDYERILWIDSDVLINVSLAPNICENVPIEKVGAVNDKSLPSPELHKTALLRLRQARGWKGWTEDTKHPGRAYYEFMGLSPDFDQVVNMGILLLSPAHHHKLLQKIYYDYEDRGGREFHMEMPAGSWELLKAGVVHWLDRRFNAVWTYDEVINYPFLVNLDHGPRNYDRIKRKLIGMGLAWTSLLDVRRACLNASFWRSFFLHFGGREDTLSLMSSVDLKAETWRNCKL